MLKLRTIAMLLPLAATLVACGPSYSPAEIAAVTPCTQQGYPIGQCMAAYQYAGRPKSNEWLGIIGGFAAGVAANHFWNHSPSYSYNQNWRPSTPIIVNNHYYGDPTQESNTRGNWANETYRSQALTSQYQSTIKAAPKPLVQSTTPTVIAPNLSAQSAYNVPAAKPADIAASNPVTKPYSPLTSGQSAAPLQQSFTPNKVAPNLVGGGNQAATSAITNANNGVNLTKPATYTVPIFKPTPVVKPSASAFKPSSPVKSSKK